MCVCACSISIINLPLYLRELHRLQLERTRKYLPRKQMSNIPSSAIGAHRSSCDVESSPATVDISPTPPPRLLPSLRFRSTKTTLPSAPTETERETRPSIYLRYGWHQRFFRAHPSPDSKEAAVVSEKAGGGEVSTPFLGPDHAGGYAPASSHGIHAALMNSQQDLQLKPTWYDSRGGSGRINGSANRSKSNRGRFKLVGRISLMLIVAVLALDLYMACWGWPGETSSKRRSGGLASGMLSLKWNRVADNVIGGEERMSRRTNGLEGTQQEGQESLMIEPLRRDPYNGQRVAVVVPYVGRDLPVWWDVFAEQAKLNVGLIDWIIFCDQVIYSPIMHGCPGTQKGAHPVSHTVHSTWFWCMSMSKIINVSVFV